MSIQYKLLLVFGIVIGFAGCVAVYAVNAISKSSELVVRMYDEPLTFQRGPPALPGWQ
jgi:hypothetical protein